MLKAQQQAYAYGLSAVMLWSTVATAFKISLASLSPVELLCYASWVSAITLGGLITLQGKWGLARGQLDWKRSLGLGFLNPFLYYLVLFAAYDRLPAQEAQPLNYTWALTLAFLSIPLLKQKITRWDLGGGLLAYGGVWVIATRGAVFSLEFQDPLGVGLALGSTLIWALYWIFNVSDTRDPLLGLFFNFLWALPWVTVLFLWQGYTLQIGSGVWGAVYVGVFEMGVAFACWLQALKRAENTARVGNLIFLSPFISLILIANILGETILASTYMGLVFIMLGLGLQGFKAGQANESTTL